ncbi:hypothetical protein HHK36_014958 [Tetracentron sinense]|uniref:Uncharacterized protein n=1 Tax=Tetracentron sinense TaxID=13715 RepID=A0A835DFP7_TETSI|nr:hypothetical protein HHK36_014958 [Tetracentron sinense]
MTKMENGDATDRRTNLNAMQRPGKPGIRESCFMKAIESGEETLFDIAVKRFSHFNLWIPAACRSSGAAR